MPVVGTGPGLGREELADQGLGEQTDVVDVVVGVADRHRGAVDLGPDRDQGRAALAHPAEELVLPARAGQQHQPVVGGPGQVDVDVAPVGGLAGVRRQPGPLAQHQRRLQGRAESPGRSDDVGALRPERRFGQPGEPGGARVEQVAPTTRLLARGGLRETGPVALEREQERQGVLEGPARHPAPLQPGPHPDRQVAQVVQLGLRPVGERHEPGAGVGRPGAGVRRRRSRREPPEADTATTVVPGPTVGSRSDPARSATAATPRDRRRAAAT